MTEKHLLINHKIYEKVCKHSITKEIL